MKDNIKIKGSNITKKDLKNKYIDTVTIRTTEKDLIEIKHYKDFLDINHRYFPHDNPYHLSNQLYLIGSDCIYVYTIEYEKE